MKILRNLNVKVLYVLTAVVILLHWFSAKWYQGWSHVSAIDIPILLLFLVLSLNVKIKILNIFIASITALVSIFIVGEQLSLVFDGYNLFMHIGKVSYFFTVSLFCILYIVYLALKTNKSKQFKIFFKAGILILLLGALSSIYATYRIRKYADANLQELAYPITMIFLIILLGLIMYSQLHKLSDNQ